MRKFAAAVLAVPVLAVIYVPVLLRRSIAARIGIMVIVGTLIGVSALGLVTPARTAADVPRDPIVPLSNAAFGTPIQTDAALNRPVTIAFSAAMNPTSVAGLVRIEPATDVSLSWDAAGTNLTVAPKVRWAPSTYHTISVLPGALAQNGRPTAVPARVAFLTRNVTNGSIAATALSGSVATAATVLRLAFDHRVDLDKVRAGLHLEPTVAGDLTTAADASTGTSAFTFTPAAPLVPGTSYKVSLVGVVDAEGASIAAIEPLTIATAAPPRILRSRPADGATGVDQAAILSVRFSESMDRNSTKAAFTVTSAGKPVDGRVSFAEKDTVIIFRPTGLLAYGAQLEMRVGPAATSSHGVPLAGVSVIKIGVKAKPQPAAARVVPKPKPKPPSGGGAVGGGSWGAAETYYLGLMNCTRTGGWVTSSGKCSSPGGRAVAPLWIDAGISSKVSRPYAKLLASRGICSHFIDGNPGNRLSRAGYTSYIWAENLACQSFGVMTVMLNAQIFFQNEKSTNGGHYVNMMNAKYDRCGIGVWVVSGRVRLVIDFYHPL